MSRGVPTEGHPNQYMNGATSLLWSDNRKIDYRELKQASIPVNSH